MHRFSTKGKRVIATASGTVIRTKCSKASAKRTARHLNELHTAKMQGSYTSAPAIT